jgi:hypothetical protein
MREIHFGLTGVDAPITEKYISKCLKITKIYIDIHLYILCPFMKFHEKRTFFVASVNKQIWVLQHCYLVIILSFLHLL